MSESLEEGFNRIDEEYKDILDYVNRVYNTEFKDYFFIPKSLSKKLKTDKITDEELSIIMLDLPLELMEASEVLSQYKLQKEVVKLDSKKMKLDMAKMDKKTDEYTNYQYKDINNNYIEVGENTLIEMVEKDITMCKELIMSAKKIWDARRKTENVNPIKEQNINELPDYED